MCASKLQVMELVELESLSQALVGKPGVSGLSVEQRKRLTIAVELVANPSIIFMVRPRPCSSSKMACMASRSVKCLFAASDYHAPHREAPSLQTPSRGIVIR